MVKSTVLSNGIRIVTETVPGVHSVSVGIWVKTGSRHESKEETGIAHFIEHMLFKGTEKYTARDIARLIDSVGGVFNAFTTKEYTCLYIKVLSQHVSLAIDILCDIFFCSLFHQDEIEKERNVIIQEINMVKDTPDDFVQELFNQAYFGDHPLGYNILGELDTVQRFGKKDIVDFFEREYLVSERIIITAAGNICHEDLLEGFGNHFEKIQRKSDAPAQELFVPRRNVSFHFRKLEQVHVCMGTEGHSHVAPERHALYVLNAI
ncbi:MAG: pitrilysin family protein, partial [Pseudomonadota bacterium]